MSNLTWKNHQFTLTGVCSLLWNLRHMLNDEEWLLVLLLWFRFYSVYYYDHVHGGNAPPPMAHTHCSKQKHFLLWALEVNAAPRLGTFDPQPCKLLRNQPAGPNPPAATGLSHDQRAALSQPRCASISVFTQGESSWMTIHVRRICFTRRPNCVSVRGPLSVDAELTQTHRPGATQDHADAGEIGGG